MNSFVLKIKILMCLVTLSSHVFSMENNDGALATLNNLPNERKETIVNFLNDPIPFAMTNKDNHEVVKTVGERNLAIFCQDKNPEFCLKNYVPIVKVHGYHGSCISINPYKKECYTWGNNVHYNNYDKWETLAQKGLEQVGNLKKLFTVVNHPLALNYFLDENKNKSVLVNDGTNPVIFELVQVLYGSFEEKQLKQLLNNALLIEKDQGDNDYNYEHDVRPKSSRLANQYFILLSAANDAKNKDAFKYLVENDPFDIKNHIARCPGSKQLTILDRSYKSAFPELGGISLMIENGFKTKESLKEEEEKHKNNYQKELREMEEESKKSKGCSLF
ncbi:MAG TPA: hypothetical protein VLB80_01280 [Candidatus Babeliales bacterium]|nr:hypothetical protein [Candidatus Babeliales bacterium]